MLLCILDGLLRTSPHEICLFLMSALPLAPACMVESQTLHCAVSSCRQAPEKKLYMLKSMLAKGAEWHAMQYLACMKLIWTATVL